MVEGDCVNENLIDDRKSGAIKLQIVPAQPKTLSHLPSRPPVDLAFHDLVYSVREGRRNRKYCHYFPFRFQLISFSKFSIFIRHNLICVSVPMTECTLLCALLRLTNFYHEQSHLRYIEMNVSNKLF